MASDAVATSQVIENFLKDFKEAVVTGAGLSIASPRKNQDALIALGLTRRNQEDEILSLGLENYCEGPEPDRDRQGEIWVFGEVIDEVEIYIKLKLVTTAGGDDHAICLSFHEAEFPLTYPYRKP